MQSTSASVLSPILEPRAATNRKLVRYWLYFVCLLVVVIVVVGGATRLTDSGLSITEWRPIHGVIPPLSQAEWLEGFEKYKLIPEYQKINKGMSLTEFKFIFWWEWGHRFLGRIIGLVFALPLVFFWMSGRLEGWLKPRLLLLLALGGLQGFIGWWMVSSGLVERTDVSQYRLAIHLTLACFILAYALWLARGLAPIHLARHTGGFRWSAGLVTVLVMFQIYLGGLVAGIDAGLTFNTWPLMDGALIPDDLLVMAPAWLNFFENPKTVQFVHRMNAYLVVAVILLHGFAILRSKTGRAHAGSAVVLMLITGIQLVVGIATVVLQAPLHWALPHQAIAIVLLAISVIHWRGLVGAYEPEQKLVFGRAGSET